MDKPAPLHPNPTVAEALSFLQAAEQSAQTGTPQGLDWAIQQFDLALTRLRTVSPESAEYRRMLALALFGRTNIALRRAGAPGYDEAMKAYEEALDILRSSGFEDVDLRLNDEANIWIARAHANFSVDPEKNADVALAAFDQAIACRKQIAGDKHPEVRLAVAGSWVNRADVLLRVNRRDEAVQSFDEAIAVFRSLPFQEHAPTRHQLATTLMNRAIAHQAKGPEAAKESLANIAETIALLKDHPMLAHPEPMHALACAYLNHAGLSAALGAENPAQLVADSARQALSIVKGQEENQPPVAEVGLRARLLLVRAGGDVLEADPEKAQNADNVAELTDAVDDGLELVRHWEKRRVAAFRPMAAELFVLGVNLYRRYQPQFLAEYALEMLDREYSKEALGGSPEMYQAALDAIVRTIAANQAYNFATIGEESTARRLEVLQELRNAEARLRQIMTPPPPTQSEKGVN